MRNTFRKPALLTLSLLLAFCAVSCSGNKDINDSSKSTSNQQQSEESSDKSKKKTEINIAVINNSMNLQQLADDFNFENELCEVIITNYSTRSDNNAEERAEGAYELLKKDILSGKTPDIIASSPEYAVNMISSGYFTDLYKLMENGDGVKQEDFLPNILEGLETDNKLPVICSSFIIHTAAAKTELVGENMENWTVQDVISIYNTLPDNVKFLRRESKYYDFPNFMMKELIRDSLNDEKNTCNLGGSFTSGLEFISQLEPVENRLNYNSASANQGLDLVNNEAVVSEITIGGINAYTALQIYADFGGADITYVGYPSDSGCGAVTNTIDLCLYGILDNSSCKEEAWNFLELMLDKNYQKTITYENAGIPVITAALDESAAASENEGRTINMQLTIPGQTDQTFYISEKARNQLTDYIKSIKFEPYFDNKIKYMAQEEYNAVIDGEKTAEECLEILNSRITLYLSEKN